LAADRLRPPSRSTAYQARTARIGLDRPGRGAARLGRSRGKVDCRKPATGDRNGFRPRSMAIEVRLATVLCRLYGRCGGVLPCLGALLECHGAIRNPTT